MERNTHEEAALIDLGAVTEQTKGGIGGADDLVGQQPLPGIADD